MATIKLKFRASRNEDKEGVLFYQIIHNREVRQIKTGYKLYNNEWDAITSKIVIDSKTNNTDRRNLYLTTVQNRAKIGVRRLERIVQSYGCHNYTIEEIINSYEKPIKGKTLFGFSQEVISRYQELGKIRTAETYTSTLNSFIDYREGEDIALIGIDSDLLEGYEAFLRRKESSLNTISFYMRKLRAIYNRAIDNGIISQQNPFKRVYTSIEKTPKRAIPIKLITKIKELELIHLPDLEFARDLFLFSFYTRGMSFIDIAYLRKKDIKNGVLTYMRRKTGQRLDIKWEKCMVELVQRHTNENTEYLLPIIYSPDKSRRQQYIDALGKVNRNLKKIANMAEIECNLTMYVARHSWASAARNKNIPLSVISEGMGHDSETTTQIYLASIESTIIDKANKLILSSV